jgi:pimeloyl-ACP methyl ester carboxylesterase
MITIPSLPSRRSHGRETVLCVHASATSARTWGALTAPLATQFEVLMPDRLGYAEEQRWDAGAAASLDAEAAHLVPLLNARPDGVHLLAHSYGAAVAMHIALRWPSRVRSLTLYEPSRFALLFDAPANAEAGREILRLGRTVGSLVIAGRLNDAAQMFVDYWSGEGAWAALDPRRQQAIANHMPKVRAEFEAAFADRVPLAAYAALDMPVRLISGDASPKPARQIVELLEKRLAQAETVVLAGVGHMGPLTHVAQVFDSLPAWLQPVPQALAA